MAIIYPDELQRALDSREKGFYYDNNITINVSLARTLLEAYNKNKHMEQMLASYQGYAGEEE